MKFIGVAYLIYMAWSIWRDDEALTMTDLAHPRSALQLIGSAVLINLLNPKLTIFFFAFLPQFASGRDAHQLRSMLILGGVFMLMTFLVFGAYGQCAAGIRQRLLDRPAVIVHARRILAVSLIALGTRLALAAR